MPVRRLRSSIRRRHTVLVALLVALTTVAVATTGFLAVRTVLQARMQEALALHGKGLRGVLRGYVAHQKERAALVASRTRLRRLLGQRLNGELDPTTFVRESRRILLDAQKSVDGFLEITIVDDAGRVLTSTDEARVTADLSDLPAFRHGRSAPYLGVPVERDGAYELHLSAPATDEGALLGVVVIRMDAASMRDALDAVTTGHRTSVTRVAALEDGIVRRVFPLGAGAPSPDGDDLVLDAIAGEAGFVEAVGPEGRSVLAAYEPVGYRQWGLVTQVDADEAYAPIDRLRWVALLTGLVVFVVATIAARRLASRLTAPIRELAVATEKMAGGDFSVRTPSAGEDELAQLATSFNEMAGALEQHRDHLEELVRDRTAELEESRDRLEDFCRILEAQAEAIERDLRRAEAIQRALLPQSAPSLPEFHVQTLYRPGKNIGGDLYDIAGLSSRHIALVIADASGHGVSAALLSVLFKHRLRLVDERTSEPFSPAEALRRANAQMTESMTSTGTFVTAAYGLLDTHERELIVASAGHTPVIIAGPDREPRLVRRTGPALGLYTDARFTEERIRLEPDDRVLFYTDGLVETTNGDVSPERVARLLVAGEGDAGDILEQVYGALSGGNGVDDRDDVTMLVVEARPGRSRLDTRSDEAPAAESGPVETSGATLTWAEVDGRTLMAASGRLTWTLAPSFFEAAESVLEAGRDLVIDLEACEYQDSTFLGTVHEVVARAAEIECEVRLQAVPDNVRALFTELSMDDVLDRIVDEAEPLPSTLAPIPGSTESLLVKHRRLLRAHEVLSSLSETNQRAFSTVVETLRKELDVDAG